MNLSNVDWNISPLRRIILFQSFSQVISFLIFGGLAILIAWISYELVIYNHRMNIELYIPVVVVMMYPLYLSLPCVFYARDSSPEEINNLLEPYLWRLGHRRINECSGFMYASKLPKYLTWEENSISIEKLNGNTKLVAPKLVISRIHDFLLNK